MMKTYEVKFNELKKEVSLIEGKISITMDLWTSKSFLSFMAIRGHWMDDDWNYRTKLFDFSYVEGDHSGHNLSNILNDCLTCLGIPYSKILGITLDNAPSNNTLFEFLMMITDDISEDTCHIRCLAHIINLGAQDILALLKVPNDEDDDGYDYNNEQLDDIDLNYEIDDDEEDVEDEVNEQQKSRGQTVIIKLRYVVRKIRKSVKLRQKLQKLCNLYNIKYLVPIIDVKTRWNSSYYMILRAEYLLTPLRNLCSNEKSLQSKMLTDTDWEVLSDIQTLLKKFERATNLVSMQRHCTISSYLPTLNWLIESVEEYVKNTLPKSMNHQFKILKEKSALMTSLTMNCMYTCSNAQRSKRYPPNFKNILVCLCRTKKSIRSNFGNLK